MIATMLPDQKRLHLQHGPIDLIIEAFGARSEITKAYRAASQRFTTVLEELVAELPLLRQQLPISQEIPSKTRHSSDSWNPKTRSQGTCNPVFQQEYTAKSDNGRGLVQDLQPGLWIPAVAGMTLLDSDAIDDSCIFAGPIARAMHAATLPHAADFITPMAAVAGAVADEILAVMCAAADLQKAYVNNGGDIALYLEQDETFKTGIVSNPQTGEIITTATITSDTRIGGIATSGWQGRSHSLGIADSVTIFAQTAARADAAATIIANQVDLPDNPKIHRQPAIELSPDSDLGNRLVTTGVDLLTPAEINSALAMGQQKAEQLCQTGQIIAAFICLQGQSRIVQWPIDAPCEYVPHSRLQNTQDRSAHA